VALDAVGPPKRRGSLLDTLDQIDPQLLDRAIRLIVGLVKQIDSASSEC